MNRGAENETLKITSSPEEEVEKFKTPEENDSGFVIVLMKPSEFKKIPETCKIEDHFSVPKNKVQPNLATKIKKILNMNKDLTKRLSDVSGLSGGSSGYQADTSSVGTGSGTSSNRDRLR